MNIKRVFVVMSAYILCATGATLAMFGIFLSAGSFFVSSDDNKFYWGGGGILIIYIGYLIYRFAFPHIQRKWDDYY